MDKIEVFGKSLNKPRGLSGGDAPIPEPFGGIPSGVFAIFAVVILTLSIATYMPCLLYTSPSPRDKTVSRMPSSA